VRIPINQPHKSRKNRAEKEQKKKREYKKDTAHVALTRPFSQAREKKKE
jgi:hypothetical protein